MQTLESLLKKGTTILKDNGLEEAGLDAWLLLEYKTGKNRAYYFAHGDEPVSDETAAEYLELIGRRAGHIPVQQLTHQAFFMGYEFYVNENVLIPRQDTETLVEEALKHLGDVEKPEILDMCTGSGCIAVSLKALGGYARVAAADISSEALEVAEKNAGTYPVEFRQSDMFAAFEPGRDMFDVIVSNPPYIPSEVIRGLEPEVRDHEPLGALDGKEDGLYFYRILAEQCGDFLNQGGSVYFETGHDQGAAVKTLLESHGFQDTKVIKDLAGMDRVVRGTWPGQIRK